MWLQTLCTTKQNMLGHTHAEHIGQEKIIHLSFPNRDNNLLKNKIMWVSDSMTELRYSPSMKMHHQNAHITFGKQHLYPRYSNT